MNHTSSREQSKPSDAGLETLSKPRRAGIPFRATTDLSLSREKEVRFREGDILELVHRGDRDWWTVKLQDENALVACKFLEPLDGPVQDLLPSTEAEELDEFSLSREIARPLRSLVQHRPQNGEECEEPPIKLLDFQAIKLTDPEDEEKGDSSIEAHQVLPPQVRAVADFDATEEGQLSYKKGDIIDVEVRTTADVWHGCVGSRSGSFSLDNTLEPIVKERAKVIWDYSPTSPHDLTLKAADIIELCGPTSTSNWWFYGFIPNRGFGTFPFNYVVPLEDEFPDVEEDEEEQTAYTSRNLTRFRVLHDVSPKDEKMLPLKRGEILEVLERLSPEKWFGRIKSQTGLFMLDQNIEPIMTSRVIALFDHTPATVEELQFKESDVIQVLAPCEDSTLWWYGKIDGRVGLFPINYVDLVPDGNRMDSKDDCEPPQLPKVLRAVHAYSSKDTRELSFDVDDIIEVMDDSGGPERWRGRLSGREGLFPRTYCVELEVEDNKEDSSLIQRTASPLDLLSTPTAINGTNRSIGSEVYRIAIGEYEAEDPDCLSIKRGDVIQILDMPRSSPWWRGSLDGKTGIFPSHLVEPLGGQPEPPSSYTIKIPSPKLSTITEVSTPATSSAGEMLSSSPGQLTPTKGSFTEDTTSFLSGLPRLARAKWDFKAEHEMEISFAKNVILEIISAPFREWWTARINGETGIVPANYIELIETASTRGQGVKIQTTLPPAYDADPYPSPELAKDDQVSSRNILDEAALLTASVVQARHRFDSGRAEELSFQAGDVIHVLKRPYSHWWKGRLEKDGSIGLFPSNYVAPSAASPGPLESNGMEYAGIIHSQSLLQGVTSNGKGPSSVWPLEEPKPPTVIKRKPVPLLDLESREAGDLHSLNPIEPTPREFLLMPDPPVFSEPKPRSKRRSTGDSQHRISLPPPPAPYPSSSEYSSSKVSLSRPGSHAGSSKRQRYSGRLSAVEADIQRAKKAYQASIRSSGGEPEKESRHLPPAVNPIQVLRLFRDKMTSRPARGATGASPSRKTFHKPEVEWVYEHHVYENQQPWKRR